MSSAEPTLAELILMAVESGNQDVHVSMPGVVVSYDAATQTAEVQPGIQRVIFDDDDQQVHEVIPPFKNVPVMHYRCGYLSIHANLQKGDGVDLVFGSESMAEWRQGSADTVAPGDLKRLGLSSPKAYPGLFPKNKPGPDTDNSIGIPGGLRIHFQESAISIGSGSDSVAMAAHVLAELNKIALAFSTFIAGSGGAAFPNAYTSPSSVASTNLKAD